MREAYLDELRDIVEEWHAGDIDFATFMERRTLVWDAIALEGEEIAAEIERTLRDALPAAAPRTIRFSLAQETGSSPTVIARKGWKR